MNVTFSIPGKPRGQGRPRAASIAGQTRVYKSRNDRLYESRVQEAFYAAVRDMAFEPFRGPLILTVMAFTEPPTSSMRKSSREYFARRKLPSLGAIDTRLMVLAGDPAHRTQRPDLSNVVKAVEDGLNGLAFVDDKQIVATIAMKMYGPESCVRVSIRELTPAEEKSDDHA